MDSNHSIYANSSIKIANHKSKNFLIKTREIINNYFSENDIIYNKISNENFREIVLSAQKEINEKNITREIVIQIYKDLINYLENDNFLIQSNSYLRASRPIEKSNDSIGWHRENFYAPNADKYVNVWTPINGVNELNTVKFIPNSQNIKNEDIITENVDDEVTKKFSSGHKIGLMYSPKKIISGVNLNLAKPMVVPYHSSSIFSGNLVHGAAINKSNSIRFSIDFRVISEKYYDENLNKKKHFASGKDYFEKFI